MNTVNEQNMLFVRHHYTCDRADTQFWVDYKNNPLPEKLASLYDESGICRIPMSNMEMKEKVAHRLNISSFNWDSWQTIHKGKSNIYTNTLI
jgi:hypothetical protein